MVKDFLGCWEVIANFTFSNGYDAEFEKDQIFSPDKVI